MKLLNDKSFKEVFFSSNWRLWVNESWIYTLAISIVSIIVWIICSYLTRIVCWWYNDLWNYSTAQTTLMSIINIFQISIGILLSVMDIFVWIKRAHDLWRKWSRLLCLLIPIYQIIVIFQLSLHRWKKEDNAYWKYNGEKLPILASLLLVIEFIIVFGWNIFWEKINLPYTDKPLIEFNKWIDNHEGMYTFLIINYDNLQKEMKDIVDTKLNCNCFWESATEKPTIDLDEDFWNEVYVEYEDKLLQLAYPQEDSPEIDAEILN